MKTALVTFDNKYGNQYHYLIEDSWGVQKGDRLIVMVGTDLKAVLVKDILEEKSPNATKRAVCKVPLEEYSAYVANAAKLEKAKEKFKKRAEAVLQKMQMEQLCQYDRELAKLAEQIKNLEGE